MIPNLKLKINNLKTSPNIAGGGGRAQLASNELGGVVGEVLSEGGQVQLVQRIRGGVSGAVMGGGDDCILNTSRNKAGVGGQVLLPGYELGGVGGEVMSRGGQVQLISIMHLDCIKIASKLPLNCT